MRVRHPDLLAVAGTALVSALVVLAVPVDAPRVVAGLLLGLVLPGYAITAATFARRPIEWPLTLALTIATSLAVLIIGALILNWTPGGLDRSSWAARLLAVTLAACAVAAWRRPWGESSAGRPVLSRVRPLDAAVVAFALVAAVAAFTLSRTPLPAKNVIGYTQLWMLPGEKSERPDVRIGVQSQEQRPRAFRLELVVGGRREVLRRRLVLPPGRRFEQVVPVTASGVLPTSVTARLYRLDRPDVVYRRTHVWVASA